jgi:Family of unknown function (DUF6134)
MVGAEDYRRFHGEIIPKPIRNQIARVAIAIALLVCAAGAAPVSNAATPVSNPRNFSVTLNGRYIGQHQFELAEIGQTLRVVSIAAFDVKILGIRLYTYRHRAVEHWENGCLQGLESSTDDNGSRIRVVAGSESGVLKVSEPSGEQQHSGCSFSYAYWDQRIIDQSQLLNPQTGRFDNVRFEPRGSETIEVRGRPQSANRFRLLTAKLTIDLWYSTSGDWLQLDSDTHDGKRLQYRLRR